MIKPDFDGHGYDSKLDKKRLTGQSEKIMSSIKFPEPKVMSLLTVCAELAQIDQSFDDFGDDYNDIEFSAYSKLRVDLVEKIKTLSALSNSEPIKKEDMTCVGCNDANTCGYVWDFYNTSGKCLANK